jgi:peptidoglycan/xylan/chitin deacetylase (PgdA/CDA1 family)
MDKNTALYMGIGVLTLVILGLGNALMHYAAQTAYAQQTPVYTPVPANGRVAQVPIFVYHIVRTLAGYDDLMVRDYTVTPDVFDSEMSYIASHKYHAISFADLQNYLQNGTALPACPVIVSFDDGWKNQYAYAFPILKQYNIKATFFIIVGAVGKKEVFMNWDDIKDLQAHGMTIGDHSWTHPLLATISDPAQLAHEITFSKQVLDEHLGTSSTVFAYPYGSYNQQTIEAVKAAGFNVARTFSVGNTETLGDIYALKAIPAPRTIESFIASIPADMRMGCE